MNKNKKNLKKIEKFASSPEDALIQAYDLIMTPIHSLFDWINIHFILGFHIKKNTVYFSDTSRRQFFIDYHNLYVPPGDTKAQNSNLQDIVETCDNDITSFITNAKDTNCRDLTTCKRSYGLTNDMLIAGCKKSVKYNTYMGESNISFDTPKSLNHFYEQGSRCPDGFVVNNLTGKYYCINNNMNVPPFYNKDLHFTSYTKSTFKSYFTIIILIFCIFITILILIKDFLKWI